MATTDPDIDMTLVREAIQELETLIGDRAGLPAHIMRRLETLAAWPEDFLELYDWRQHRVVAYPGREFQCALVELRLFRKV